MRHRGISFVLLLIQAVWLNVILPGHQRGAILLAGSEPFCETDSSSHACCGAKNDSAPQDNQSPAKRMAHCAVCAFALRVTPPPAENFDLSPLEKLGIVQDESSQSIVTADLILSYHGRAPPAA